MRNAMLTTLNASLLREYSRAGFWGEDTIYGLMRANAEKEPDKIAIVSRAGSVTYRELLEAVDRLAGDLSARGLGSGDRVAVWAPNMWEWPIAALGAHGQPAAPAGHRFLTRGHRSDRPAADRVGAPGVRYREGPRTQAAVVVGLLVADGEEHDVPVWTRFGQPHRIQRRIHDADVSSLGLDAEEIARSILAERGVVEVHDLQATILHLLGLDPPRHTQLRSVVSAAFTPRRVAALEPAIRSLAEALLDAR